MRPAPDQVSVLLKGIRKLRILADTWYPWNQKIVTGRLHPVSIRRLAEEDIPWCEELHIRNHRFGVPEEDLPDFQRYLRSEKRLVLVMENRHGERVGSFGLFRMNDTQAMLCHLLIEPPEHARGYGTTAVIAAISLLAKGTGEKMLHIHALPGAMPFYRKLGFLTGLEDKPSNSRTTSAALEEITPLLILDCVSMLAQAGVTLPDLSDEIPLAGKPRQPPVDNSKSID